ncbi:hypothetical protein cand_020450 [Cryptosporidium andersoni]|uniref:Fcf2 pre-rRNA processing C-terminal domain-containing protein n=1 Tax=Cryptosporidium andersoni TaxID=117008 RepID=A0A1J4MT12_9CRYT|nr:hypothetical protein cand_020450 [Cryptosporidium andersoni]
MSDISYNSFFSGLKPPVNNKDLYILSQDGNDFDTQAPPGVINISSHHQLSYEKNINVPNIYIDENLQSKSVNNQKQKLKEIKLELSRCLKGWFGLPLQEHTPEILREFRALHLRNSVGPKAFYKSDNSMKNPPKYFSFGRVIDNSKLRTGFGNECSTAQNTSNKSGSSFVQELVRDSSTQKWANMKYNEIQTIKQKGAKKWYKKQILKRRKF